MDDPDHIELEVHSDAPGILVLADTYDPNWTATVDGVPTEIRRANVLFRAVEIPSGKSRVEFRYRPSRLGVGLALSGLATTAWMGLAALWWIRRSDGRR